jgi:hypothetical protein
MLHAAGYRQFQNVVLNGVTGDTSQAGVLVCTTQLDFV